MADKNAAKDRLALMRERMQKHKSRSESGANYWKPKEGRSRFRILPPKGNMDLFFQEVGKHVVSEGKDEVTVLCPNFTTSGELPCYICELSEQAYREQDKDLSTKLRVRRYFYMNVIVYEKDKDGEIVASGPFVYTPGVKVFETLTSLVGDPDYGDISDADTGRVLTIDRTGKDLQTEYQLFPRPEAEPLFSSPEELENFMESVEDLSTIKDRLMSYEEMVEKFSTTPSEYTKAASNNEEEF